MQPPSLPVKYWRRFKYMYDTAMRKVDHDLPSSLGFISPDMRQNMLSGPQDLAIWKNEYAFFLGSPDVQLYWQQHEGWQLECVKHCKVDSDSPWHEFLVLQWRHVQSQALIFQRLERYAGEKKTGAPRGPTSYVLSKHHSKTSIPRSIEMSSDGPPDEPSGPLKAWDKVGFYRAMSEMEDQRPFVVLASFTPPGKDGKVLLTFRDVLEAALACRELSDELYDFRYMCFWFSRMIYETLLYKAGCRAIDRQEAPPTESLSPRCNDMRGCIKILGGCWHPRVNKLDLKWRTDEQVPAQWAAFAETITSDPPSHEQPNFFQQIFSSKKAPKPHAALQRMIDKDRDINADFERSIEKIKRDRGLQEENTSHQVVIARQKEELARQKETDRGLSEENTNQKEVISRQTEELARQADESLSLREELARQKEKIAQLEAQALERPQAGSSSHTML